MASTPPDRAGRVLSLVGMCKFHAHDLWLRGSRKSDFEDLLQDGYLGAIYAVDHWDESRDITLMTYANMRIRGEIIDGIRRRDFLGRKARDSQRGVDPFERPSWTLAPMSLDVAIDGETARDWLATCTEPGYAEVEVRDQVVRAVSCLKEKPRYVVEQYYLRERTGADIARELHVTESRISQILAASRRRMSEHLLSPKTEKPKKRKQSTSRRAVPMIGH